MAATWCPLGATNLVPALGRTRTHPVVLTALVLAALEWAMAAADQPETVRQLAESRLLTAEPRREADGLWCPVGLTADGGLVLNQGERRRVVRRQPSLDFLQPAISSELRHN